jgi:hypothetical protein
MIKRDLNNIERQNLKLIKEKGYAYELKYYKNGYMANVPKLCTTFCLNSKINLNFLK